MRVESSAWMGVTNLLLSSLLAASRHSRPPAGDVRAEGGVGDGRAVLVGEALPDGGGGDVGVCLDHRVDVAVQAVQGCGLAVDLLPFGRVCGCECPDDGAAADVVLALDRPLGHPVASVAADRGVLLPLGCLVPLDVLPCVAPCGRPGSGWCQLREGTQDCVRLAVREAGQHAWVDGAVAASGGGEVAAQVGEAQVVGGGEPAQVGVGGLAAAGAGPDRERENLAAHGLPRPMLAACEAMSTGMASMDFLETCSVPSMTAWMAALRISQSRLPIIPLVRWWR